jgi:hypothetical protein
MKILGYICRYISIILLIPAFLIAIPGGFLHILGEEILDD